MIGTQVGVGIARQVGQINEKAKIRKLPSSILRQVNAKTTAFSQPAFNHHLAAVGLGNVFDNRQSKASSAHTATT